MFKFTTYLQFVPGYCADVVHSEESNGFSGEETVNSIFAVPHVTDKFYKRKQPYHPHEIIATVTQKFVFNNLYFTKEDTQLWRNFFFTNLQFFKNL